MVKSRNLASLRRMFFRLLYRICNSILLNIRILNPPTLMFWQMFYCVLRIANPNINKRRITDPPQLGFA